MPSAHHPKGHSLASLPLHWPQFQRREAHVTVSNLAVTSVQRRELAGHRGALLPYLLYQPPPRGQTAPYAPCPPPPPHTHQHLHTAPPTVGATLQRTCFGLRET